MNPSALAGFIDEIGDVPLELQPKLLPVLQERGFKAVGSTRTTRVDAPWYYAASSQFGNAWMETRHSGVPPIA
jgi:transcriptional regulator with GAF, ATPase, and Fis domain